ncbi:MAG TPA: DUF4398 domain-containing protein [Polyangiaceae bacterium]|nr:DUF4398 domain-containing protein [Polyangiaceae bacterium]
MRHKFIFPLVIAAPLALACGGSFPPPTQRLAEAQSAERSATELGAADVPAAQLSLKLSHDQITQAQQSMAKNDNERADTLLIRAKADAELAIAQAREKTARLDHQEAVDNSAAQAATNVGQGAIK